jgi:DNA repair protein RadC
MQLDLFSHSTPCTRVRTEVPEASRYLPVYRVQLVHETVIPANRPQLGSSADAARLLRQFLRQVDREHFVVLLVDRKNRLIGIHTVSVGSLTASVVHPREVFKVAILSNAAAILCGHNHPSGDPQPSGEDHGLTRRLVQAGAILGIDVLDHVIIGDGAVDYYSFADQGLLHPDTNR